MPPVAAGVGVPVPYVAIRLAVPVLFALVSGMALTASTHALVSSRAAPGPDLIVDAARLAHNWMVHSEDLEADDCAVQEGGVQPGLHPVMRFTVSTPNIGMAPVDVGDPLVHVANNDGLFEYATCHNHFHFRHYTLYQLVDPKNGHVWRAAK